MNRETDRNRLEQKKPGLDRRTLLKTASDFDSHGSGFGVSVVTRRDNVAGTVGTFGWDGGLGTSWRSDPKEDMVTLLLTQRAWTSSRPPDVCRDFWTLAYQAIDD